jgi:hypothetical protein
MDGFAPALRMLRNRQALWIAAACFGLAVAFALLS